MMQILPALIGALIAGLAVGLFYFGGLWWTVCRLKKSPRPAFLTLTSFVLRTAVLLGAFYWASRGRWEGFLGCLAGVLLARLVTTRRLGPRAASPAGPGGGDPGRSRIMGG